MRNNEIKKTQALILAGGKGGRFGGELPKQFTEVAGKTIIEHTLDRFEHHAGIDSTIIVINAEYVDYLTTLLRDKGYKKLRTIISGGETRSESSSRGINACDADTVNVLIHDAARPFVTDTVIGNIIGALDNYEAVVSAISSTDTIICVSARQTISHVPARESLMRVQTPQGFRLSLIKRAYELYAQNPGITATDDGGLVIHFGLCEVFVVYGDKNNIKVTYPEDVYLADKLL